ncbi:MAG: hypothetical protein L0211_04195 [Planctomycetaceae bacterium]|nr:hypothetical protein [Planctomycetaceae bacterium]
MKTIQVLTLSVVVLSALAPAAARAQSWSFSIGHGHGHHHHYDWHHHCHDPFWCGPHYDYLYVAPPPVVRREIRYVQPIEETTVETRVLPPRVSTKQPVATSATAKAPLQIWNSAGRRASVAFLVDGQEVALNDGQSHTFYGGGSRTVEYDRGSNFGTGRAVLTEGEFEFVVTSRGWDLVRRGVGTGPIATRSSTPKNELPSEAVQR